jgi:hypothetical protein
MDYNPPLADFCDILRDYSLSGLSFYRNLAGPSKKEIFSQLGLLIEDDAQALEWKFSEVKNRRPQEIRLVPMPKPSGTDFFASFFVPQFRFLPKKQFACSFSLLFWVNHDGGRTIAFRLEPAGEGTNAHGYSHVQISQLVKFPRHETSLEKWVPTSYPAFPCRLEAPLHFFAAAAMAVHGFNAQTNSHYFASAITAAMQTGGSAERARRILSEVQRAFCV